MLSLIFTPWILIGLGVAALFSLVNESINDERNRKYEEDRQRKQLEQKNRETIIETEKKK